MWYLGRAPTLIRIKTHVRVKPTHHQNYPLRSRNGTSSVRYSDIFHWKDRNRSSSFEVPPVLLLSDDKRIYFHETAGHGHLNLRQLCAIESSAKKNPDRSVQVFFQTNHVNLTADPFVSIFRRYPWVSPDPPIFANIAGILINVRLFRRNGINIGFFF